MVTTEKSLAAERQEQIHHLIRDRRVVRVEDLSNSLNVSPATIRRDLVDLETRGAIRRVHGGAVSVETRLEEPLFDDKTSIASREKAAIAQAAAKLINTEESIYLDGGSTVLELARIIKDRTDITVVTNSLRVAVELSGRGPRLILVGGELRRRSETLVGPLTRHLIDELHIDKAFMGTIGLTLTEGLTTTDANEAFTKSLISKQARQVILLADSSKIGQVTFARSSSLNDVHHLITDSNINDFQKKELKKGKLKLTVV